MDLGLSPPGRVRQRLGRRSALHRGKNGAAISFWPSGPQTAAIPANPLPHKLLNRPSILSPVIDTLMWRVTPGLQSCQE